MSPVPVPAAGNRLGSESVKIRLTVICSAILLMAASALYGQGTCGDVQLQLTPDYSYAIGSSSSGTSYSFMLGGSTLAQGSMTQLALFHYDSGFTSTSGVAPTQSNGASLVPGKFGSAVTVASSGILAYPQPGNLSTQDGTIEMWIAPQYDGTNSAYSNAQALFEYYWGGSGSNQVVLAVNGSGSNVYLVAGVSGIYAGYAQISGFAGWKAGEWHHLAMTYSTSQSRLRLYIDGVLVQERDDTIAIPSAAGGTFSVASGYGSATNFAVDEVRISNDEMPAATVAYDATRTGPFANNEVYLSLAGVNPGQLTYAVGGCGSASLTYTGIPITNFSPASGLLAPGSTSVAVSFNTVQPTLCRYSTGTAQDYASMQPLDTGSPVLAHSGVISGLSSDPRVLNSVYVRCASNQDFLESLAYRSVAAPTGSFPRIGSIWQGEYILTTKPAQAAEIQVYFAPGGMTPAQALALRAQNPSVLIMPSVNAQETTGGYPAVPSSYLLYDVNGNTISDWPGNYLLNMTMPEVATFLAQYAVQQYLSTASLAFDGLFWDNFNTSIQDPYYDYMGVPHQISSNNNGVADDPTVLNAKWSAGIYTLITSFNQLAPNAYAAAHNAQPVPMNFANFNGVSFTNDAPDVREGTESFGYMLGTYDAWFSSGRPPVISAIQSAPPSQIAYGYGYNPLNNVTPSVLNFSQTYYPYMRFGLATALMNNGFSIFDFGDNQSAVNWWYDEYDFTLGQPLGPAVQIGSSGGSNLLLNGGFESGLTDWSFIVNNDGQAQATISLDTTSFVEGKASAHIDVISVGTADWHVDLEQPGVSLAAGQSYQLTFWARADQPRVINLNSQGGAPNYPNYGLSSQIAIGTLWKMYSASFVAPVTATDGRIQFFVGDVAGNVWIDGVQLTQVSGIYRRDFTNGIVLLNSTSGTNTVSLESGLTRFTGSQAPLWQYIVDDAGAAFTADSSWQTVTYDSGNFHEGHYQPPYYHAWNSTAHLQNSAGSAAQWNLQIPADGQYTIQVWLPAAPGASSWTKSAVYEVVSGTTVLGSATVDQTTASAGDAWHSVGTFSLTAAGAPFLRIHNGGSGSLIADAVYVTSAALYNDGSTASQVTLAPFDGILLKRRTSVPVPASITIQTNPAGLLFSVDGTEQTAPLTLNLAAGSHTIAVPTTQVDAADTHYLFSSWSDGGAASHTITVGSSPATYTANFQTQYQLNTSASPAGGGTVSPASGAFYGAGTEVNLTATPNKGYVFTGWTGEVANSSTARTTLTMSAPETVTATFGPPTPLQFIPVTPCRIVDTRWPSGPFGGPEMGTGATRSFDIPQSTCGIPSTAVAYSLNATVVPDGFLSYLTLWPTGEAQPYVSTLNSDGRVKANAAIVPAGTNGGVSVYVSNPTQVILDIDGYFVPAGTTSALAFYPVTPCRVVDTEWPTGPLGGPSISAGGSRSFPVTSSGCGIPSTAQAYSLNITAVPHSTLGYLTAWATGQTQPYVSTLNSSTGTVVANAAIVPASTSGDVSIFVSDAADVILDINGYFAPPGTGGLSLYTVPPCRVIDTRPTAFTGTTVVNVEGSTCAPPSTAQAYVLNATVVPPGSLGYLTLWPDGEAQPYVSTLNALDGAITSNMAIVPTNNGKIDAYASNPTNLILDLSSYFAP